MLPPMSDPVGEPPLGEPETAAPEPQREPAYLPFGAYAAPSALTTSPPPWTRTYELPSARQVVSAGLQLAAGANRALRRASVYIGLLSLGAFGPAAILVLVGIGRLLNDPTTATTLTGGDPLLLFTEQPGLAGPLTLIYAVAIIGIVLLVAISIDAEAMAIATLGGAASGQAVSLPEAIRRARQTFWRLLAATLLVNVASGLLSLVIALPFLRPFDTNQGVSFIASMIATLAVTPFAFAATGIVLGDAGPIETLRRSVRLFRARPRIALVVTLFTLVTAAIQSFAFGGGADIAARIAEFFHIGQGATSLILPGILVLALIVAFGSLTFTIAAIVAAPQVAAFLGLTFFSGGLDRARTPAATPVPRVRWVSVPMTVAMAGLGVLALVGLPTITGFQPREPSPLVTFLREAANAHGQQVAALGPGSPSIDDPASDTIGTGGAPSSDIVLADIGWLPDGYGWLLDAFDCGKPGVACGSGERAGATYYAGAFVFYERLAAGPDELPRDRVGEWGPLLTEAGSLRASAYREPRYPGASHAYVTRRTDGREELVLMHYTNSRAMFEEETTSARSIWAGDSLITIVPIAEIDDENPSWDEYAGDQASGATAWSYDILRTDPKKPLLHLDVPSMFMTLPTTDP